MRDGVTREAEQGDVATSGTWAFTRALRAFALHDLFMAAYLVAMLLLLAVSAPHPHKQGSIAATLSTLVVLVGVTLLHRVDNRVPRSFASHLYRATIASTVVVNYGNLRNLLPVIRHDIVDETLASIDLAVLGQHPAILLEPYTSPAVVEFFAFFYYGYFFICIAMVAGALWLSPRNGLTSEYAIGTSIVYGLGQLGYTAVPGIGPIFYLESAFQGPLQGGFFWQLVLDTVNASGAHKDVFPSLHTAAPVYYTLHALRRGRHEAAWRWPSRALAVAASCIVVSTIVLRWHYVVDVMAGLALATFAYRISIVLAAKSLEWRKTVQAPPVWDSSETAEIPARASTR